MRVRPLRYLPCLLLLGLLATSARPSLAIVDGTATSDFGCVGVLLTSGFVACTGTLIDGRWGLTSAACREASLDEFEVGFDWTLASARHYAVGSVVPHPQADPGHTFDFARVRLLQHPHGPRRRRLRDAAWVLGRTNPDLRVRLDESAERRCARISARSDSGR